MTSKDVTRFEAKAGFPGEVYFDQSPHGEWVRYEDYAKLSARISGETAAPHECRRGPSCGMLDGAWECNCGPETNQKPVSVSSAFDQMLQLCREMEEWLRPEVTKEPDRSFFWRLVDVVRKAERAPPLLDSSRETEAPHQSMHGLTRDEQRQLIEDLWEAGDGCENCAVKFRKLRLAHPVGAQKTNGDVP